MSTTTGSWRDAIAAAGREIGIDALTETAIAELTTELPALITDPDLRDCARTSAAANIALVLDIVSGRMSLDDVETPPQAAAFARELARRNVPVSALDRAYRVAALALWRWAVEELRHRVTGDLAAAIQDLSEAMLETGNAFSAVVLERYAAERERWRRSADAVRATTVQDLLAGRCADVAATSARLRYDLHQTHQAFVAWAPGDGAQGCAEAIAGGRGLLWPMGRAVAGWCPPGALDLAALEAGAWVALGTPARGVEGFRSGHAEAREARRIAELFGRPPGPVAYDEVALVALLTHDLDQARRFAQRTLGPLAEPDPAMRRLAETLRAVLEHQGSLRRAGEVLGVHENTVAKRMRTVDRLIGRDARRRPGPVLAALAVLEAPAG